MCLWLNQFPLSLFNDLLPEFGEDTRTLPNICLWMGRLEYSKKPEPRKSNNRGIIKMRAGKGKEGLWAPCLPLIKRVITK
mgnify:CR=1 FL=1